MSNELAESKPKRGRGGKYNFPSTVDPSTEDSATISAVLSEAVQWLDRGQRDRASTDEEVYERTKEYLTSCISRGVRPTVEAYCLALGYARQTVNEWKHGTKCSPVRADIIKRAFEALAAFDAGMVSAGQLNTVLYIFRSKNYYDLKDTQDVVVTPSVGITDDSAESVASRYAQLPPD